MAEGETAESIIRASPSLNPGSYEDLNFRCKSVFPTCFEGSKIMVQKGLSSHFQVMHTLSISPANTGYKFGATYVGSNQLGPNESFPVVLGDTDAAGNTSATIIHQFKNNLRLKFMTQVHQGNLAGAQATVEHRGRLSTSTVTFANIDLVNESGVIMAQYLRRLAERFDVGAEFCYHYGHQVPGGKVSILSYAARYIHSDFIATASVGITGYSMSYFHKQHPNLSFGVEHETNFRFQESVTTLGYQAELPEEGVTMRASINTNWTVMGVLEKRLSQALPFTLALSGVIDHVKNAGKFGIGLIIG